MTTLKNTFRKLIRGEGRPRGSLEPTLTMLLIGLVMGLLLQSMNLRNRDLVIDSLETKVRTLEMRLWIETQSSSYQPHGGGDDNEIRDATKATAGVLICDAG